VAFGVEQVIASFRYRRLRKPDNRSKFVTNDVGSENVNGFAMLPFAVEILTAHSLAVYASLLQVWL
jgi:hypothetical protein